MFFSLYISPVRLFSPFVCAFKKRLDSYYIVRYLNYFAAISLLFLRFIFLFFLRLYFSLAFIFFFIFVFFYYCFLYLFFRLILYFFFYLRFLRFFLYFLYLLFLRFFLYLRFLYFLLCFRFLFFYFLLCFRFLFLYFFLCFRLFFLYFFFYLRLFFLYFILCLRFLFLIYVSLFSVFVVVRNTALFVNSYFTSFLFRSLKFLFFFANELDLTVEYRSRGYYKINSNFIRNRRISNEKFTRVFVDNREQLKYNENKNNRSRTGYKNILIIKR